MKLAIALVLAAVLLSHPGVSAAANDDHQDHDERRLFSFGEDKCEEEVACDVYYGKPVCSRDGSFWEHLLGIETTPETKCISSWWLWIHFLFHPHDTCGCCPVEGEDCVPICLKAHKIQDHKEYQLIEVPERSLEGHELEPGDIVPGSDPEVTLDEECHPAPPPTPPPTLPPTTLDIDITSPGAAFVNQAFDFTVTVDNIGANTATNVVLTVALPAEGSFVSSTPPGTVSGDTLSILLNDLDPGDFVQVVITWQAPATQTTLTAVATASADNAAAVSDDDDVQVGIATITTGGVTSAGTGLRNRAGGTISIAGIPVGATVTRAVLVWAILYRSSNGTPSGAITFGGNAITADLEQTISGNLCWGDDATIGYAADVTSHVSGNGSYRITDAINGDVRVDSNPAGTLPFTDGASLIVFYGGPGITNQVLSDFSYTAGSGITITRSFTGITSVGGVATLHLAGPDGQNNAGEDITVEALGAGVLSFPNTWDGSAPQDAPDFTIGNLWDNDLHDVSTILPVGQTTLDVVMLASPDCIGLSAVALEVGQ